MRNKILENRMKIALASLLELKDESEKATEEQAAQMAYLVMKTKGSASDDRA